jgi:tRNA(Met) cytidine acetyltransferase
MTAEVQFTALPALIDKRQQQCKALGWRLPIWLQDTAQDAESAEHSLLAALLQQQVTADIFWLGEALSGLSGTSTGKGSTASSDTHSKNSSDSSAEISPGKSLRFIQQKHQLLGAECDVLVVNAQQGIDWDLVAASAGCVKAGGLWILYSPTAEIWQQQTNNQAAKLRSYPHPPAPSAFLKFWLYQPEQNNWLIYANNSLIQDLSFSAANSKNSIQNQALTPAPYLSADQQQAVQGIFKVLSGHRRRPLLISAHRGRGKSAALGIAAAQLQQQGKTQLAICAPHPDSAAVALAMATQHLQQLLPDAEPALRFWPVDLLLAEKPKLDLLFIDEAAAIPTPQLQQLVAHYSRVVLASTEHGYEGTGRGFLLKFQPYLDHQCPGWHKLQLQQAIRYAADCPLEQLIFQRFLLATDYQQPCYQPDHQLQLQLLPQQQLGLHPLLPQIMALLSLAHYQTSINDLWALLDNPALQLFALKQQDQILACAVISIEGDLPEELGQQIYQGKRRVQGQLMAQSLAFHLACPELAGEKLARVQRIAVSPVLQHQGLGSKMLKLLQQHFQTLGFAAIGSSFGCTAALLRFWQQAGFAAVKLSQQAEKASSEPSVLVLHALQQSWQTPIEQLQQQFSQDLYRQLSGGQKQLCAELALQLVSPPRQSLSAAQWHQLQLFAAGNRPFELVELLLLHWFNLNYQQLAPDTAQLLVKKLWQQHSWQQLAVASLSSQLQGKQAIQQQFQRAVATVLAASA